MRGAPLKEFLGELLTSKLDLVLLTVVTDAASANNVLFGGLAATMEDAVSTARRQRSRNSERVQRASEVLGLMGGGSERDLHAARADDSRPSLPEPLGAVFQQHCLIHQVQRTATNNPVTAPVRSALRGLTRLLQMRRHQEDLVAHIQAVVNRNLVFTVAPCPDCHAVHDSWWTCSRHGTRKAARSHRFGHYCSC